MYNEIGLTIRNLKSREELRKVLVSEFLKEQPGQGKGELASKYRYNVETLSDGRKVFLLRPANLNKGFDFTIHVERTRFKKLGRDLPTHYDIFEDLKMKKADNQSSWGRLYKAIELTYALEDPDDIIVKYGNIDFDVGHPTDLILKVIKWFFIEQDMTYWNWSGRRMFMDGVRKILH